MIIKTNNRFTFILIYGLFLGYILSFLYSGPLFNFIKQNENIKSLYLLIIFISGILSCIITYKFKLKTTKKILSISLIVNIFFSVLLYFIAQYKTNNILIAISCISACFIGFSAMFVSNTLLAVSKKYNKYEEIFINIAIVMLVANIISYVVYVLLSFSLNIIALTFIIFCATSAVVLIQKIEFNLKDNNLELFNLNKHDLYIVGCIIFLLKISEGIIYKIVEYEFAIQQNNYEYIYIFPYIFALIIAFFISYKTKRRLFSILSTCISLIGIGLLLLLISDGNVSMSNFLMHFGFGLLDVIIWGAIIYFIHVYNNSYKIASFIMFFQMLGVLIGGLISELYLDERKLVYIVAIICVFVSIVIVPKVNDITIKELDIKKKILDKEKCKMERLQSKEKYNLLSKREKEVVGFILQGKINREIANSMYISETTVKTHCKNIYKKLDVKNKKELKIVFKDE